MPKDDWMLSTDGLQMPAIDGLFNMNSLSLTLNAFLGRSPADYKLRGLWTNFNRITDKTLREYDAARVELMDYAGTEDGLRIGPYLRAIDHLENCIDATYRAVLNSKALRTKLPTLRAPVLTERQEHRLRDMRHVIQHADDRLTGGTQRAWQTPFKPGQSFSLRLDDRGASIGAHRLTYRELVSAITKMHRTVELIRGSPGDASSNAVLRTHMSSRATSQVTSPQVKQQVRLAATN